MLDRPDRLSRGDGGQQPPEVFAIVELRKLAAAGPLAEAVEGAQRHVLLVTLAAGMAGEPGTRQRDQAMEVAVPEPLDIGVVARPQAVQPARNRSIVGHSQRLRPRRRRSPSRLTFLNYVTRAEGGTRDVSPALHQEISPACLISASFGNLLAGPGIRHGGSTGGAILEDLTAASAKPEPDGGRPPPFVRGPPLPRTPPMLTPWLSRLRSARSAHNNRASRRLKCRPLFESLESRQLLTTFTVTNTHDTGAGTLRQAIISSNAATTATNNITFNIPCGGVQTITPLSPLPTITQAVVLDGTTQPGTGTSPRITLNGSDVGVQGVGLTIQASNSTVRGLAVAGCLNDGVVINGFGRRDRVATTSACWPTARQRCSRPLEFTWNMGLTVTRSRATSSRETRTPALCSRVREPLETCSRAITSAPTRPALRAFPPAVTV